MENVVIFEIYSTNKNNYKLAIMAITDLMNLEKIFSKVLPFINKIV